MTCTGWRELFYRHAGAVARAGLLLAWCQPCHEVRRLAYVAACGGLAAAGGFKDFAKTGKIYVLRRNADGTAKRMPFNYKDVIKGHHSEQNVALEAFDTIVVP